MSGWEIAAFFVVLVLVLVIGVGLLIAYLLEEDKKQPSRPAGSPLIVFREKPDAPVKRRLISFRPSAVQQNITPRQFNFSNNGQNIETREIKDDLDLLCKVTCRVVRECRCKECRRIRTNLGI